MTSETAHCISHNVSTNGYDFYNFEKACDEIMSIRDVRKLYVHSMPHGITAIYRNTVSASKATSQIKTIIGGLI